MENQTEVQRFAYVSQGARNMMYTLWTYNVGSQYVKPLFIKNLSTSKEEALKEAMEFSENSGRIFLDESADELKPIKRVNKWTESMVTFGKNRGIELSECDDKFILWVAKGCPLFDNKEQVWANHYFGGENFQKIAQTIAVEKNLGVIENDKFYTNDHYAKLKAKREQLSSLITGHHYSDGERIELNLKLINEISYESVFGIVRIYKFIDQENKVYTYKGNKQLFLEKNQDFKCKATIKHDEYKGEKTTYIQRIK